MSTTNIDEQKMQQIDSSDTITQFMEKCNNNFSNIFRYRSGPEGKQGVEGSQGVPTKPKVPIHVWIEGVEYYSEKKLNDGYVINLKEDLDLTDIKYQEGHLIMLKNGHVYILKEDENSTLKTLKPNYIMSLQSYNQDDVVDGRSAYIHIAYAISTNPYVGFITNEQLQESQKQGNVGDDEGKYKYMGIYSNYEEKPDENPYVYTWIRIVGDTGEKGDKGDKGDTPTSTSVEVVGYSLDDLKLNSEFWKSSISELGELKPGTPIYIKNRYTWNDGTVTYGKTVTMAGTQGIKGETGRVLFYLGSFSDGTLTGKSVKGYLNEYRCDYYIDATGQAWMRTGTSEIADGHMFGKYNIEDNWVPSDKVGFLQAGAISADMINVETLAANKAFIDEMVANKAFINNLVADEAVIKKIQSTEISADYIKSGKISSDGEKSYFDLDTGEFVLGNDNGTALKYENGKLTIGGVPSKDDIEDILTGLVGDIDIEIGGRNLLKNSKFTNLANGETYDKSTYWICNKSQDYAGQYTLTVEDGHLKLSSTFASLGENWDEKTPRMGFYQTKENKSGQEYVLSFDAYADTPVYIKAASGYGSWNEKQRVQISTTKERYSIKMIGANGNDTTGNISGYNIFFLRLDDKIQTSIYFDNFKLEEGTVATDWTPAPEDVDDAIAAVDSKAQALEYLKKALTYETDIAGGIVATTSIQLRDKVGSDYVVNAGISGIENDNVLLWGGGTYDEAVNAASKNNDYHVEKGNGGRQITSLLKKDGQGKIGIFKISDTQAVVKTNQGEILIDASDDNCGVYVRDNNNSVKTAIVGGEIEDYAPLDDEVIVSKNANIKSDTYNNGVFCDGSSGTCTTERSVTFNLKQYISISEPCYCKVSVKVYGRLTQGFYNTEYKNSSATIQFTMDGEACRPLSNSIYQNNLGYAQNGVSPGQYYMEISHPIQTTSEPMATYNKDVIYLTPNKDFEVKVNVTTLNSGAGWCLAKLTGDLTFVIEVTRLWSYGYEPKTIIATDGIMTAYDNKNYFMIKNTSEGQQIYAKGLNKTKGTPGSGELYISNTSNEGLLKTLKDAFIKISDVLNIAKYEGNDAEAQTAATTAINNAISELDKISIIANS